MAASLRESTLWLALAFIAAPAASQEPASRPEQPAGSPEATQEAQPKGQGEEAKPNTPAEARPLEFGLPGEDDPQPFVPLRPLTVEDRKRIDALRYFSSARALEKQRRWAEAIELLEKALAIDPDALPALRRLSRLYFVLGSTDKAIDSSRRALNADPSDTATLKLLVDYFAVRKNDPAAAEAILKEVLASPKLDEEAPARLLAYSELGQLYAGKLQQIEPAADAFAKVVDGLDRKAANTLSPADRTRILGEDEASAYMLYGQVFSLARRPELAVRSYQRGLVYNPDHPLLPLLLAQAFLDSDRGAEALETLEPILKRQPSGREAYELLAQILTKLGREDEILPRLEAAAAADSKNMSLQYALADRYRAAGQTEKADALYKALLAAQPDLRGFPPVFASLLKEKKTDDILRLFESAFGQLRRLEPLKEQIDQLLADPEYANQVLDRGLEMLKADPPQLGRESWIVLTRIASDGEKLEKLVALQQAYLAKYPNPQVMREIADTLIRKKQYREAASVLEDLIGRYPDEKNARLLVFVSRLRAAAGQNDVAIEAAREAIKLEPNESDAISLLVSLLGQSGKFDEAIELTRKALKADPANPILAVRLGVLLSQSGKEDDAIGHFRDLLDQFPNNDELVRLARSQLSIIYTGRGDFAKGEAELEALLARDPDDPLVNNDLGYLYAEQGKNLDKAESMIRRAVEAEPDNAAYLDSLGWVLYKKGKVEEAVEPLEKAVKLLETPDATIHDHLGDVYFQLKDWAKARAAWTEAEQVATKSLPPDKRLPEIRKKLQSLDKLGNPPRASTGDNP